MHDGAGVGSTITIRWMTFTAGWVSGFCLAPRCGVAVAKAFEALAKLADGFLSDSQDRAEVEYLFNGFISLMRGVT